MTASHLLGFSSTTGVQQLSNAIHCNSYSYLLMMVVLIVFPLWVTSIVYSIFDCGSLDRDTEIFAHNRLDRDTERISPLKE